MNITHDLKEIYCEIKEQKKTEDCPSKAGYQIGRTQDGFLAVRTTFSGCSHLRGVGSLTNALEVLPEEVREEMAFQLAGPEEKKFQLIQRVESRIRAQGSLIE